MTAKPWKNPNLTFGTRCVLFAKHEMERGVRANPYPGPNTSKDVKVYLAPCLRNLDADPELENLGLVSGNWCAAFACYCAEECVLPGEVIPHHYRAGVVELVADARELGLYHPVQEVREGIWTPSVGDLVIWDRSEHGRPETDWWRHVNRVVRYQPIGEKLTTIGGNEGRRIQLTNRAPKRLSNRKLQGFISYHQKASTRPLTESERVEGLRLVAMFAEAHRQEIAA